MELKVTKSNMWQVLFLFVFFGVFLTFLHADFIVAYIRFINWIQHTTPLLCWWLCCKTWQDWSFCVVYNFKSHIICLLSIFLKQYMLLLSLWTPQIKKNITGLFMGYCDLSSCFKRIEGISTQPAVCTSHFSLFTQTVAVCGCKKWGGWR